MNAHTYSLLLISGALLSLGTYSSANAASFDCAKASTKIEKAICGSAQVSKLDSDLDAAYKGAIKRQGQADAVKIAQRAWVKDVRNACQDESCLINVYKQRIGALSNAFPQEQEEHDENIPPDPTPQLIAKPSGAAVKTTGKPDSSSDAVQISDGYRLIFTAKGEKSWWKRAAELDRNGWKFGLNRAVTPGKKVETDKLPFKCSSNEFGLPLGPNDSDIQWVPAGQGSDMEKAAQFICGTTDAKNAAKTQDLSVRSVGRQLSPSEAKEIDQIRLGKCAAHVARLGQSGKAEEMMAISENRLRTRTAYARNYQLSAKNPDAAKEESMDACTTLGMIKGGPEPSHLNELTAYEEAHSGEAKAIGEKMKEYVANTATREADAKAVRAAAIANDPVAKLRSAYAAFNAQCQRAWGVQTLEILKKIDKFGPRDFDNQTSTVEINATGEANLWLKGLRGVGCAGQ